MYYKGLAILVWRDVSVSMQVFNNNVHTRLRFKKTVVVWSTVSVKILKLPQLTFIYQFSVNEVLGYSLISSLHLQIIFCSCICYYIYLFVHLSKACQMHREAIRLCWEKQVNSYTWLYTFSVSSVFSCFWQKMFEERKSNYLLFLANIYIQKHLT